MDATLTLWRRATAEGLAAFALVFAGCGAIVANHKYNNALGSVGVSLTFGPIINIAGQLTGATTGALLLLAVWTDKPAHLGATVPSVAVGSAFAYETVLTVVLMFVIIAVATDTRAVGPAAAIAIGATVGLDALFGGAITGASMNPARSLGPALVSGTWGHFWIYIAGPVLGATLGAFAYQLIRGEHPKTVVE